MTTIEPILDAGRRNFARITATPLSQWGMLPNPAHLAGGGYHCGCQDIINIGRWGTAGSSTADYSVRQKRDRVGGNVCMAIDGPPAWGDGGNAAWIRHNNLLQQGLAAGDPELGALRAINYTPDGVVKRRYDTNNRSQGIIPSTDTVLWHTHYEFWRDTEGTSLLRRTIARMGQIMQAAIDGITSYSSFVAQEVRASMAQVLVKGLQPDPNQIWLCDGMFRRKVNTEWVGNGTGPITNAQTHQPTILGNLGWGGAVFASGGDPNVWGVDISTFDDGDLEFTDEQLDQIGITMAEHLVLDGEVVEALQSDAGQAALTSAANKAEDS